MAYGLDVEEVYYTDHERNDIGLIDHYEIDVDLADEKDFQIKTHIHDIPVGGFWYVPDTEYGGLIYGMRTDSSQEEAEYTGKTWRGILHDHILTVPDNRDVRTLQGEIDEIITDILAECNLDGLFNCVEPDVNEGVDTFVDLVDIPRGTSAYDAIIIALNEINFTLFYTYNNKVVTLTPMLAEDYSDYMVYSSIGALNFEASKETRVVNHYIMTSVDDANKKRTLHLFKGANGEPLPYATTDTPKQDSDYIRDTSQQELFGVDEVCMYKEVRDDYDENPISVTTPPKDWRVKFGEYYHRDVVDGEEVYTPYEATESITYTILSSAPSDWATNYSKYYNREIEDGEYVYRAVNAESVLDTANRKAVAKRPRDWKTNYGSYYYRHSTGTEIEYLTYSGVSKEKKVKLTIQPSDWSTNFSNYLELYVEQPSEVEILAKLGKKTTIAKAVAKAKSKYIAVRPSAVPDAHGSYAPKFKKNKYYKKETYQVAPTFDPMNTYMIPTTEVAPTFGDRTRYRQVVSYLPPKFIKGDVFRFVEDHYAHMVEEILLYFDEDKAMQEQKVTMNEFNVSIGDRVAGRDEYTGEDISATVVNINANIKNGILECEYIIGG